MKLVIVPQALSELHDAAAFYKGKGDVSLGLAFVAEFERTTNLVLENPMLGAIFRGSLHNYIFRRFPYRIIYQITGNELRIIAVAHQRRRPDYWANR